MTDHRERLSGIFAPIVTPFRDDDLRLDDLRFNLRRLRETDLSGYLALGSNGEFRSLRESEAIRVLEVFAGEKGEAVVMAGTGCESTRETIERSRAAAAMGLDYVSVLTPGYFARAMDGPTLREHYERIADASPLPVVLYNAPRFANGVRIPPETARVLAKHPNIAGMKDSSPTGPAGFLRSVDPEENFAILAGSASFLLPSLYLGAPGGILSLANALPDACCDLHRLFREGRHDEARALGARIARVNDAISGAWGVAGVKAAMKIAGFRGGEPRRPLAPLSPEAREGIREALRAEGFSFP